MAADFWRVSAAFAGMCRRVALYIIEWLKFGAFPRFAVLTLSQIIARISFVLTLVGCHISLPKCKGNYIPSPKQKRGTRGATLYGLSHVSPRFMVIGGAVVFLMSRTIEDTPPRVTRHSPRRSGRRRRVRSRLCVISHSFIFASCPDKRMSGTRQPLYSAGRV